MPKWKMMHISCAKKFSLSVVELAENGEATDFIASVGSEKDANLISAAPDMLKAINSVMDILDNVLGDTDPDIDEDMTEEEIRDEYPIYAAYQLLAEVWKKVNKN